ncbi:hypothetical protein KQI77_10385 [Clostridium sp. MSJ-8]|uniref:hypothetical protein n=1 Tax=Clostridium sp. MSJ-8 TaxID=2841510 RepID=UPI001C0EE445|nr:hypothetical protein [Clostridium sp. MSJ-8]MBU5488535.1 hypothetical protein [Clostridium sp. MSJ-8]
MQEFNDAKKEKIKSILLMPIECEKTLNNSKEIKIKDGKIYSSQKYYSNSDEDMCDFAIGFYEILYSSILDNGKILLDDGTIKNCCFAGDTMNSFNKIANLVTAAGKTVKARTDEEKWPKWLREYKNYYHCLANFWILPTCIGRRSLKLNYYDSMDIFLEKLKNDNLNVLRKNVSYYQKVSTYEKFTRIHILNSYENIDAKKTRKQYKQRKAEDLVKQAKARIEQRAQEIIEVKDDEYHYNLLSKLWEYFKIENLIK